MGSLLGSHYHPKSREAEQQWMNIFFYQDLCVDKQGEAFFHEAPQS